MTKEEFEAQTLDIFKGAMDKIYDTLINMSNQGIPVEAQSEIIDKLLKAQVESFRTAAGQVIPDDLGKRVMEECNGE